MLRCVRGWVSAWPPCPSARGGLPSGADSTFSPVGEQAGAFPWFPILPQEPTITPQRGPNTTRQEANLCETLKEIPAALCLRLTISISVRIVFNLRRILSWIEPSFIHLTWLCHWHHMLTCGCGASKLSVPRPSSAWKPPRNGCLFWEEAFEPKADTPQTLMALWGSSTLLP